MVPPPLVTERLFALGHVNNISLTSNEWLMQPRI